MWRDLVSRGRLRLLADPGSVGGIPAAGKSGARPRATPIRHTLGALPVRAGQGSDAGRDAARVGYPALPLDRHVPGTTVSRAAERRRFESDGLRAGAHAAAGRSTTLPGRSPASARA